MSDLLEFLKFLLEFEETEISRTHVVIAVGVTIAIYLFMFLVHKFIQKQNIKFNLGDFLIKVGCAFVIEFGLIWVYGPKVFALAVIVGILAALYIRNKLFSFIDINTEAENDLKLRMELAELKNKFKKNPYYSILEVLLYYGYISAIQKETVETENIFKTPEEMAREFLSKPILTAEQLDEAIGIMNVIRREGKILTREEALLLIMNMKKDTDSDEEKSGNKKPVKSGKKHTKKETESSDHERKDPSDTEHHNSDVAD